MHILTQIFCVTVGSIIGSLLRWQVGVWFPLWFGRAFPWATLFVNISGCLFLGWFLTVWEQRLAGGILWLTRDNLRLFLAVGFTGTYTTFSTFGWESDEMYRDGDGILGTTYVIVSVVVGLLAVRLGVLLGRLV